jgi:hypothetical protein
LADGLDALARDLSRVTDLLGKGLRTATQESGKRVRDEWREAIRPHVGRRLRHVPQSITYETRVTRGAVEAEIGPDKNKRQGPLAHVVQFGTSRHGPIAPARDAVVDAEEPRFVKAVYEATEGLL